MTKFTHIIKRDGNVVPFTPKRIANAIYRAAVAVGGRDRSASEALADQVVSQLEQTTPEGEMPNIEQIQDMVEKVLIENGRAKVAKPYILYREERARQRENAPTETACHRAISPGPSSGKRWTGLAHITSTRLPC